MQVFKDLKSPFLVLVIIDLFSNKNKLPNSGLFHALYDCTSPLSQHVRDVAGPTVHDPDLQA